MEKRGIIIWLCCLAGLTANAQQVHPEVLCTASGTLSNSSVQINWTLGETITLSGGSGQLSSGFVQPVYVITALPGMQMPAGVKLYPNPLQDQLILQWPGAAQQHISYRITDGRGAEVKAGTLAQDLTLISCAQLVPSVYLFQLFDTGGQLRYTYKFIKQ